jgi:hypothetical protein
MPIKTQICAYANASAVAIVGFLPSPKKHGSNGKSGLHTSAKFHGNVKSMIWLILE